MTEAADAFAEIERSLLGAVLVDPKLFPAFAELVSVDDFADQRHRLIAAALMHLGEEGKPLDLVTLRAELVAAGHAVAAGGPVYLAGLLDGVPRVLEDVIAHWGGKLREEARKRRLSAGLKQAVRQADEGLITADEFEALVERLVSGSSRPASVHDRDALARASWQLLEDELAGKADAIGSGLQDLDARLRCGGWRRGQMVGIGARPGFGKTALLTQFGEAAAAAGHRVLAFTLEMAAEDINVRRLVANAGVSLARLRSWRQGEREKVTEALQRSAGILQRSFDFATSPTRSLAQLRAACRRHQQRRGLDVVLVDYLGLVQFDRRGKDLSLYERTTAVSQGLKGLAMELGVVVLVGVQLNREPQAAGKKKRVRPSLSHFRDSGAIEQDLDVAILIHQDDASGDTISDGDAELILAKQRNGPAGRVNVRWRAECARFEPQAPEESWRG